MALIRETTRQQAVRLANVRQAEHLRVSLAAEREAASAFASRYVGSSSPRERSVEGGTEAIAGLPGVGAEEEVEPGGQIPSVFVEGVEPP
jgi:hypothetical protein